MTRQEFKTRWESDDQGGNITFEDIHNCAISWGICSRPKTKPMLKIKYLVLKEADVNDLSEHRYPYND